MAEPEPVRADVSRFPASWQHGRPSPPSVGYGCSDRRLAKQVGRARSIVAGFLNLPSTAEVMRDIRRENAARLAVGRRMVIIATCVRCRVRSAFGRRPDSPGALCLPQSLPWSRRPLQPSQGPAVAPAGSSP